MSRNLRLSLLVAVLIVLAGAALWWVKMREAAEEPAPVAQAPATAASAPVPEPPKPIEVPVAEVPLTLQDIPEAIIELVGRKAVASFLQLDEFPRRLVATVDNLGRDHAPPILWPVNPTPDRFMIEERGGESFIHPDNASRYTPFVLLVETVDVGRAVALYVRMYPLLQRAYEELGYPNRYFNDRLIAVVDQLLATPAISEPLKVELTEVKGPIPSVRPWVRYQFADPALESLSAGQKILLRTGPVNERRLKGKLAEFRAELAQRAAKR